MNGKKMQQNRFLILGAVFLSVVFLFSGTADAAEVPSVETPVIITTCGQSPGAVMVKMSLLHSQITPADTKNDMTAADLAGKGYKTLIVTTGTSGKGMGAAGTDVNKEIARCKEIIKAARDEGMVVITAHVEGMARRTDQADQDSIDEIIPLGDAILIITSSNPDGYFTKLSQDNNKPLIEAKDALAIGETIKALKK